MKKKLIAMLTVLTLILCFTGCGKEETSEVQEMMQECVDNLDTAKEKYLNQYVEITGVVEEILPELHGRKKIFRWKSLSRLWEKYNRAISLQLRYTLALWIVVPMIIILIFTELKNNK